MKLFFILRGTMAFWPVASQRKLGARQQRPEQQSG